MARTLAVMLALTVATSAGAQSPTVEISVTGEHRFTNGGQPALAKQLALLDAQFKAWRAAVVQLGGRPEVKELQLKPPQLEAYAVVILEPEEQPALPATKDLLHVSLRARLDAGDAARRMAGLRKDQDATFEVVDAWTRLQRLHREITERPQPQTVTTFNVTLLTARAYAAMARTEPATVGGGVSSAEGRERARRLAGEALAISPEAPEAQYLMGDLAVEAERPDAAEVEYRKALGGDPRSVTGRTKLAAALRYQGKFPEAVAELRQALTIDPSFARAHADLGLVLRAQKQLQESIAEYREAVRLDPELIEGHNGLAVALANSGKLEEALAEFREIVRIDPDSTIGHYNIAYVLADLDRDVESAAALREVVRINPNHYNARFNLGELFRLESKFDDAAKQFREYLRLAPDTPQNQRNISRARRYVQQFENP